MPSSAWEVASANADSAAKRDTERQKEMPDTMGYGTTEKDLVVQSNDRKRLAVTHPLEDLRKLARVMALVVTTIMVRIFRSNLRGTRFQQAFSDPEGTGLMTA